MRRRWLFTTALLGLLPQVWPAVGKDTGPAPAQKCPVGGTCGQFGTSVEFVSTPSEAARRAKKEEKLVFVLHVSGHFEDPKFT